jgi:fucose permease
MIPILSAKWGISDDRSGYLFSAQFAGAMLGTLATSSLFTRLGYIRPIALAFFLMSGGTAGLALSPWPAGLATVFIYGVGLGIVIPGINLYVAGMAAEHPAAALNTLNFLWGIGAVSGPPAIALLSKAYGVILPHFLLAALLSFTGVVIVGTYIWSEPEPVPGRKKLRTAGQAWRRGPAILIALFVFLYVGMENSVGGWAATYASRITRWPERAWPLASLVFWGALMAGRGAAPAVLRRVTETRLAVAALLVAVAGNVVIISAVSGAALLLGISIAGLGFATLYPMAVGSLSKSYGPGAARAAPFVFGTAALGGATLPWVVGYLSASLGSLRLGLLIPLAASIAMFVLQKPIACVSQDRGQPETSSSTESTTAALTEGSGVVDGI